MELRRLMAYRVPLATYRLQFNAQFRFADARRIAPYLAALGITDIYASPLLRSRAGSTHGYDVVDAMHLNPELGTDDAFMELCGELDRLEMGLLLDIVPNHMAASHENAWWMSVLENGPQSRYVHFFDIDWRDDKVLLPILGKPYGETLEAGEIKLGFDAEGFFLQYWDKRLPVAPRSYVNVVRECVDAVPAEGVGIEVRDLVQNDAAANSRFLKDTLWRIHEASPEFRDALHGVIERFNSDVDLLDSLVALQWYRLAYWRIASETINYRRFFDVTDLVGLRVENPEVFEVRNRLILDMIAEGKLSGVRIDHIDGLFDPVNYLTKLQLRLGESEHFYVVVEKILEHGEVLPPSFRCAGTTGYDFLDTANALFVDPSGLQQLTEFYRAYTGLDAPYANLVYERKKQVIDQLFYGEIRALGAHLTALAAVDRDARDFSPSEMLNALIEITACMPVYRSYVRKAPVTAADRTFICEAVKEGRRRGASIETRVFDFVESVLLLEPPRYAESERDKWLEFVMRWQQFTGRVMAKGVEDTAFYNYNRLLSLNEVGGEPGRGAFDPVADLHERNARIARDWPHTMNATSTHDTKRSEDVRARINVLSEIPDAWQREVRKWTRLNAPLKNGAAPDANEELMIYQTLVGAWPIDADRMRTFLEKAAREAKTHSSWITPNGDYERALQDFATAILAHPPFLEAFERFHKRIALHGAINSLAQIVVKACSPGLPDFYQGTELWDFSLVDPDNRRPVDWERHIDALQSLPAYPALLRQWPDGRVKLFTTAQTLAMRARHVEAFRDGAYRPIETGTPHVVAFTRGEDEVLIAVPRLTARFRKMPLGPAWDEHALGIGGQWHNAFTGESVSGDALPLREVFATFPVAVLERE